MSKSYDKNLISKILTCFCLTKLMRTRIFAITCLLLTGLSLSTYAMEFQHGGARTACRDPQACAFWIEATGEFTDETDKEFLAFLKGAPNYPYSTIRLSSAGGNMESAIRLGLALRSRNFTTETNFCASACLYAFLGGVERRVIDTNPKVGIHRFYYDQAVIQPQLKLFSGMDMDDTQRLMAGLLLYTSQMGVDPRLIALSIQAGPLQMRWLSTDELREFNVTYEPNTWTPWRIEVPSNYVGLVAVSETQDKSRSMQIVCSNDQINFTIIDKEDQSEWFAQCKSTLAQHSVLGAVVPSSSIRLLKKPDGISFKLPKHRTPFSSASIFSEGNPDYPMVCQSDRYLGTSLGLKKMATLVLKNCLD